MKKIKKALVCFATVAALSASALVACGTEDESTAFPGGSYTPGTSPVEVSTPQAANVLAALKNQQVGGYTIAYNGTFLQNKYAYDMDDDYNKVGTGTLIPSFRKDVITQDISVNTVTKEADLSYVDLVYGKHEGRDILVRSEKYNNVIRGGKVFDVHSSNGSWNVEYLSAIEDIKWLEYVYNIAGNISIGSYFGPTTNVTQLGNAAIKSAINSVITLGDTYGALTASSGKLTIDVNKVAYGLVSDVKAVVNGIKGSTTVNNIIASRPIRSLIGSLTDKWDAKALIESTMTVLQGYEGNLNASMSTIMSMVGELLPAAQAGEGVYPYIYRLLNDRELTATVVQLLREMDITAPQIKCVGDLTMSQISEIFTGSTDISRLKGRLSAMVDELVNATEDTLSIKEPEYDDSSLEYDDSSLKNAEFVVSFNAQSEITSLSFSAELAHIWHDYDDDEGYGLVENGEESKYIETQETLSVQCTVNLSASAVTLHDIGDPNVVCKLTEFSSSNPFTGTCYANSEEADLTLKLTVVNNRITDIKATDGFLGNDAESSYTANDSNDRYIGVLTVDEDQYYVELIYEEDTELVLYDQRWGMSFDLSEYLGTLSEYLAS